MLSERRKLFEKESSNIYQKLTINNSINYQKLDQKSFQNNLTAILFSKGVSY